MTEWTHKTDEMKCTKYTCTVLVDPLSLATSFVLLHVTKNRCDTTQSAVGHAHFPWGQRDLYGSLKSWPVNTQPRHRFRKVVKSGINRIQHNRKHLGAFYEGSSRSATNVMHSHVTGNRGVSGHRLGREVVVAVGAVEERLSPLAVDKIGLQDEAWARAGHRVQWAATWWRAIVHIETAYEEKDKRTKVRIMTVHSWQ